MVRTASVHAEVRTRSTVSIECPVIRDPSIERASIEELQPLLVRLERDDPVVATEVLTRGTLTVDGRLDLCKQGLGPEHVGRVIDGAARYPSVRHLLLGTNGLGHEGTATLASRLAGGHGFETLYLGCNSIDAAALAPLSDELGSDTTVSALWLKRNPIGDTGLVGLARALRTNRTLRTLDLVNTGITDRGVRRLAEAVAANHPSPLEHIYLGGNGLGADDVPALIELIDSAPNLSALSLAVGDLGDSGLAMLTERVMMLRRPTWLGLGSNALTSASASTVGRLVCVAEHLDVGRAPSARVLGGPDNQLGAPGATAIAEALDGSRLRALDISHNDINSRAAQRLADALERAHHQLHNLVFGGGVAASVRRRVDAALKAPNPLDEQAHLRAIKSRYR